MGWRKKTLHQERDERGFNFSPYCQRKIRKKRKNKLNKFSFHFQAAVKTANLGICLKRLSPP